MTRLSAHSDKISIYDAVRWMTVVIWIIQTFWTIARANTSLKQCWRKNNRWHQCCFEFSLPEMSEIVLWTARRDIVACLPFHNQKNAPPLENPSRDSDLWGQRRKLNFHKYFWELRNKKRQRTESLKQQLSEIDVKSPSRVLWELCSFSFSLKTNFLPSCFSLVIFHLCLKMLAPHSSRLMVELSERKGKKAFFSKILKELWSFFGNKVFHSMAIRSLSLQMVDVSGRIVARELWVCKAARRR